MKRPGALLVSSFVAAALIGCSGGGIEEGMADPKASPQPDSFRNMMEGSGKNMMAPKKPAKSAAPGKAAAPSAEQPKAP